MRITVIGAGNMGGALVKGWAKAAREAKADLSIIATAKGTSRLDKIKAEFPEVETTTDNVSAAAVAQVIVIAVKPWMVAQVMEEIENVIDPSCIVMSVAAGVEHPGIDVYTMPNIAVEFAQGMSFVKTDAGSSAEAVKVAAYLLGLCGKVMLVDSKQMNAGNMLAGCGIAYVMRMIRAMMEGGVELGLYPDVAKEVAMQAMLGAVTVLDKTNLHPEAAIDKVTTAGGLTIKGLNELDHAGFNSAVIRCLKAGSQK